MLELGSKRARQTRSTLLLETTGPTHFVHSLSLRPLNRKRLFFNSKTTTTTIALRGKHHVNNNISLLLSPNVVESAQIALANSNSLSHSLSVALSLSLPLALACRVSLAHSHSGTLGQKGPFVPLLASR